MWQNNDLKMTEKLQKNVVAFILKYQLE